MDGFGDFEFTQKITAKACKTKPAAVLLVELVNKYPGNCSHFKDSLQYAILLDIYYPKNIQYFLFQVK